MSIEVIHPSFSDPVMLTADQLNKSEYFQGMFDCCGYLDSINLERLKKMDLKPFFDFLRGVRRPAVELDLPHQFYVESYFHCPEYLHYLVECLWHNPHPFSSLTDDVAYELYTKHTLQLPLSMFDIDQLDFYFLNDWLLTNRHRLVNNAWVVMFDWGTLHICKFRSFEQPNKMTILYLAKHIFMPFWLTKETVIDGKLCETVNWNIHGEIE